MAVIETKIMVVNFDSSSKVKPCDYAQFYTFFAVVIKWNL